MRVMASPLCLMRHTMTAAFNRAARHPTLARGSCSGGLNLCGVPLLELGGFHRQLKTEAAFDRPRFPFERNRQTIELLESLAQRFEFFGGRRIAGMILCQAPAMLGQTVQFLRVAHHNNPPEIPRYSILGRSRHRCGASQAHTKIFGRDDVFYQIMMSFMLRMNNYRREMDFARRLRQRAITPRGFARRRLDRDPGVRPGS
jgi:hypothetical protein